MCPLQERRSNERSTMGVASMRTPADSNAAAAEVTRENLLLRLESDERASASPYAGSANATSHGPQVVMHGLIELSPVDGTTAADGNAALQLGDDADVQPTRAG